MRIIRNHLLPPKNYDAINILGLLFCRRGTTLTAALLRHERIHTAQMLEMGIVGFYLWYVPVPPPPICVVEISQSSRLKHARCQYLSSRIWFRPEKAVSLHKQGKRESVSLF